MSTVNMSSIEQKALQYLKSNSGKKNISETISRKLFSKGDNPLSKASDEFIDILKNQITSSALTGTLTAEDGGLGRSAINALLEISASAPKPYKDKKYCIDIFFDSDLTRPSLISNRYEEVRNIAALLNNGYDAGKYVYGTWHSQKIRSLKSREGAHFIDESVRLFRDGCAAKYGIEEIEVNEVYEHS